MRVTLSRRLVLVRPGDKRDRVREAVLAVGTFPAIRQGSAVFVSGKLKAGMAGRESGWDVQGIARVEHVLRMSSNVKGGVQCERIVHLSTDVDEWSADSSPAWGLKEFALPRDDCGMSTRFTGV